MPGFKVPSCAECGSHSTSVLETLTVLELETVDSTKTCRAYDRGGQLFQRGQHPQGLFCIHAGHVKITREGHDGREQIIRFAGPGDVIGYGSLVAGRPYHTAATAVEKSHVCFIPRDVITRAVRENPQMALRMMQMMSGELDEAERRVVELAQKSVRERVAEALLVLRETFGVMDDGETLNMQLTREEIADIVGTAPESVIRMLSDLRHDHIIDTEGRRIVLKNVPALIKAANVED
ncbi:MAG: Crp/Fnr family transcriptional regulator [Candidatus Kapabacteria bacterium]|nr:Crp/Fnr family transcriptional regulator [Candidatus Kapabacteria bacterium]